MIGCLSDVIKTENFENERRAKRAAHHTPFTPTAMGNTITCKCRYYPWFDCFLIDLWCALNVQSGCICALVRAWLCVCVFVWESFCGSSY